jgi:hypothetical protein
MYSEKGGKGEGEGEGEGCNGAGLVAINCKSRGSRRRGRCHRGV